jgi:hypothetical protein
LLFAKFSKNLCQRRLGGSTIPVSSFPGTGRKKHIISHFVRFCLAKSAVGSVSVCPKSFGLVLLSAVRVPAKPDERKPKHPEDVFFAMQLQGVLL